MTGVVVCAAGSGMPCCWSVSLAHRHRAADVVTAAAVGEFWVRARGSSFYCLGRCCCGCCRAVARHRTSAGIGYV